MARLTDPYKLLGATIDGKYTIEAVVDRGGYGLVYRAMHEILREPVALKFFTGLAQAPASHRDMLLDRFAREGKLMMQLSTRSANIVQARDIGALTVEDGTWMPYLVLEWLEGRSLEQLLYGLESPERGVARPLVDVFRMMDGVARALAMAHASGIAHRDIKPGNFFVLGADLRPGTVLKLLDFGIAKVMPSDVAQTQGNDTQFTPKYGAPEQFDRVHGATGPWTDVYGFALVVIEAMRGGPRVFSQRDFMAVAIASQDPVKRPTPRGLGLEVSDAVEAVFLRALAVKVADRYENLAAFWNSLAAARGCRWRCRARSGRWWCCATAGPTRRARSRRCRWRTCRTRRCCRRPARSPWPSRPARRPGPTPTSPAAARAASTRTATPAAAAARCRPSPRRAAASACSWRPAAAACASPTAPAGWSRRRAAACAATRTSRRS
jgi:hypothetical protein